MDNYYLCVVRIIAVGILRDFWTEHPDAEGSLKEWYLAVGRARWNSFSDLKKDFGSADYDGNQKVVFNIKGNKYRLIAAVKYTPKLIYIRYVGTHAEYDKIDESTPSDDPRLVELDMLSSLVEEYEKQVIPVKTPSLTTILLDRMAQANCTQKEFAAFLGISAPRFSDILTGKKTPTYQQARDISSKLDIDPTIVLAL